MSKRQASTGKTPLARDQHERRDLAERLGKASAAYDVPDRARPSKVTEHIDPYEAPTYYSVSTEGNAAPTTEQEDIVITDYPSDDPFTDMSKAPLFFGKPGQFEQVTTWCEITFRTNTELSQDKAKQAAFFASLFRGPALTWFAGQPDQDDLLNFYPKLKVRTENHWTKSSTVKKADAARKLSYITQRRNVQGFAQELDELARILELKDDAKEAIFKRGLKQHVREALVASNTHNDYSELVDEAERIDSELFSIRRTSARKYGSGSGSGSKFAGKCNSCGQFGHKARDCRKGPKRESDW